MRKIALAALFALAMAGTATAADFPRSYAAPYGYNWAGFYVGLNLGYEWGSVTNSGANVNGFMGGIQAGHNWQANQFVYGVETDLQGSGADDRVSALRFVNPWFGTLRGRAGIAAGNMLFFATGGIAYGGTRIEAPFASESHDHFGWTVGLGAEVGLTMNWSVKFEYLYVDLSSEHYALTALDHEFQQSLLRFGFNYRF